jgi:RNA polymerase sigma-70 factor (ECF subfamily)
VRVADREKSISSDKAAASNGGSQAQPNWRAINDEGLLRHMADGHPGAFDELFSRHSAVVLSFLSRLTAAKCDPEDLLQETFLRVLTHAKDFRAGAAFRPWLFTIARNVAYNSLQKRKLRSEVEIQTDFSTPGVSAAAGMQEAQAAGSDPSARMQSQEQKTKLLAALEELPEAQREVIVLVVFNNFSYEEAAAITGDSEGTLRSRVFHALKKLRDRLKEPV